MLIKIQAFKWYEALKIALLKGLYLSLKIDFFSLKKTIYKA